MGLYCPIYFAGGAPYHGRCSRFLVAGNGTYLAERNARPRGMYLGMELRKAQEQMKIETKYDIGQTVYIKHDGEQEPYMLTKIEVSYAGIYYQASRGNEHAWFTEIELHDQPNYKVKYS